MKVACTTKAVKMTVTISAVAISSLADWIGSTFPPDNNLIAMLATDTSRREAAEMILSKYWYADAELQDKMAALVNPAEEDERVRLSALRQALTLLAKRNDEMIVSAEPSRRDAGSSQLLSVSGAVA